MNNNYLEAGKIVSTHGIKGEVKVLPWADSPEFLTRFRTFYLVGAAIGRPQKGELSVSGWQDPSTGLEAGPPPLRAGELMAAPAALAVESSRVQKSCVLVKFKGIDTVEDAQKLRDRVISIARDDPRIPAGTVFQADLIGLPVRAGGVEIGKITEILTMPASDVWVVKGEKTYMIPNVKAFVPKIDLSLGCVDVNLIEGMQTDEN